MSAKPLYGSRTSVTVTLNSLADDAIADSNEYDNTSDLALSTIIEVNATGSNILETGSLIVYAREGLITATDETDENLTRIGSIALNGTTAVKGIVRYEGLSPFYTLSFKQSSSGGYALGASGNTAFTVIENIQDV